MKTVVNLTAQQRKVLHRGWESAGIRKPFESWLQEVVWHGDNGEIHVEAQEGWVILGMDGMIRQGETLGAKR